MAHLSPLRIAVCGCGPAGLSSALFLHRSGHKIVMFDQFPQPQPVGSGLILQPTGLAVLSDLGLLQKAAKLGSRLDRLFGRVVPSNRIALNVQYSKLGSGYQALGIHRSALFNLLHNEVIACGIEKLLNVNVNGIVRTPQSASIITSKSERIGEFDLVVNALGAHSPLSYGIAKRRRLSYGALWTNVPWLEKGMTAKNALEQRYSAARQMAGILPIGCIVEGGEPMAALFWSLKRSEFSRWKSGGLEKWKADVMQLWPEIEPVLQTITDINQLTFSEYDHFTSQTPFSDRLVHLGDAAHSTSPQLGQGANMALLDALAFSRSLNMAKSITEALQSYACMRRWHIRLFQWASWIFSPFYQSDSVVLPFVRDWMAAPASTLPIGDMVVARLVSGMTISPLRGTDFTPACLGSQHR